MRFDVVHADEIVAVVDKPAGLVVHPGAGHDTGTLVGGLLDRFPELARLVETGVCAADRPGIVHRLDKGTSGLLAVARTAEAYRALADQLATRSMERRYLALVIGPCRGRPGRGRGPDRPLHADADEDGGDRPAAGRPAPPTGARAGRGAGARGSGHDAARRGARERPNPPDPCPHGGHRPPGRGGRPLRSARRRLGVGPLLLARRLAPLRPSPDRRRAMEFSSPLPDDLRTYLDSPALD